jgi:ribonuclease D
VSRPPNPASPEGPAGPLTPIVDAAGVARVAAALTAAPLCAFDLEFVSAERLIPGLCLVQVSWLPHLSWDAPREAIVAAVPELAILDAQAVDVGPVIAALAAHGAVIAHAPRQDLGLLATRFGVAMPHVVDLQLMAAFAGIGDQVGLGTLAKELLGVTLDKDLQWTDWSRRPLSAAHLRYAAADVRYLPALHAHLTARLGARLAWARAESALVADEAVRAAAVTPATAWQELGLRGLDPAARAAAGALAAWRLTEALASDRPLGHILAERTLLDLARARPRSAGALRAVRGISDHARHHAEALIELIASAPPLPDDPDGRATALTPRAQRWSEGLQLIVQLLADELALSPRLLASRGDAEAFARAVDDGGLVAATTQPALTTWRRDVLATPWLDWLGGRRALAADVTSRVGVRLV